jgi:hypothetical protein
MKFYWVAIIFLFCFISCTRREFLKESVQVDAFAEMVKSGVKPLALSPPLSSAEMDLFFAEATRIAEKYEIELHRESDLIETDLFSDSLIENKEVLILYKGNGLLSYQALKNEIEKAKSSGTYTGDQRLEFSRRFGRLLQWLHSQGEKLSWRERIY